MLQHYAAEDARLLYLLPTESGPDELPKPIPNGKVLSVGSLRETFERLAEVVFSTPSQIREGESEQGPDAGKEALPTRRHFGGRAWALVGACFLMLAGAAAAYWPLGIRPKVGFAIPGHNSQRMTTPNLDSPSVTPVATGVKTEIPKDGSAKQPEISLREERSPAGLTCLDVLFGNAVATLQTIAPKSLAFPDSDEKGLCALAVQADGKPVDVTMDERFLREVMKSDRTGEFTLEAGQSKRFRFMAHLDPDVSYTIGVANKGAGHVIEYSHQLVAPGK